MKDIKDKNFNFITKNFKENLPAIHSILWQLRSDLQKDFNYFYNDKETLKEYKDKKNKIIAIDNIISYIRYKYGRYIFKHMRRTNMKEYDLKNYKINSGAFDRISYLKDLKELLADKFADAYDTESWSTLYAFFIGAIEIKEDYSGFELNFDSLMLDLSLDENDEFIAKYLEITKGAKNE